MLERLKKFFFTTTFQFGLDSMHGYLYQAEKIPGWVNLDELAQKGEASRFLPGDAIIVEIGAFLGRSTIVIAGARKLRGNGIVHSIDPFDASGDAFSVPVYKSIEDKLPVSLLHQFEANIEVARLQDWVKVHQGTSESVVQNWHEPIDMLILDGDQSPQGARAAYDQWIPFLKSGGVLVVHNSSDRAYEKGHDGHRLVVVESVLTPYFSDVFCVRMTTFARKV